MTTKEKCAGYIQLTFRDDQNNGLVTLGGIGLMSEAEVQRYWEDIPRFEGETAFIADRLDGEHSIIDDRLVSAETCEKYLGKPIAELIDEGRAKTCFTLGDSKKKNPELASNYPSLFDAG